MSTDPRLREHARAAEPRPTVRLDTRLALRPKEAAAALGLSERAFRALLPELPHLRAGGAVLVPVDALRRWLEDRARIEATRAEKIAGEILETLTAHSKHS